MTTLAVIGILAVGLAFVGALIGVALAGVNDRWSRRFMFCSYLLLPLGVLSWVVLAVCVVLQGGGGI